MGPRFNPLNLWQKGLSITIDASVVSKYFRFSAFRYAWDEADYSDVKFSTVFALVVDTVI